MRIKGEDPSEGEAKTFGFQRWGRGRSKDYRKESDLTLLAKAREKIEATRFPPQKRPGNPP